MIEGRKLPKTLQANSRCPDCMLGRNIFTGFKAELRLPNIVGAIYTFIICDTLQKIGEHLMKAD